MEHPTDESVVNKISLNKPEQTPTNEDSEMSDNENREKYFNELRLWLNSVSNHQNLNNKLAQESVQKENNLSVPPNITPEIPNVASPQFVGFRCQIPSLWKRFGAEFIDFILLCIIKFVLVYIIIDSFIGIDYKPIVRHHDYNMDYPTVRELISKLLVLEVSHRIVVFFYEIYWLHGSTLFHGGGTIGKTLLSLTVVRADKFYNIRDQPNDIIALTPGSCLGWKCAILRSLAKNVFFSLMFPLPFITAPGNQNRCVYDFMCGTIVVEILQPLRCDQSELIPII